MPITISTLILDAFTIISNHQIERIERRWDKNEVVEAEELAKLRADLGERFKKQDAAVVTRPRDQEAAVSKWLDGMLNTVEVPDMHWKLNMTYRSG